MRAVVLGLSLILLSATLAPSHGQQSCSDVPDTTLVYDPDELLRCPPLPSEIVPSTVGRPQPTLALELADCAGRMDALTILRPIDAKPLVPADTFMTAAVAQPERPNTADLAKVREEAEHQAGQWLPTAIASGSSTVIHAYVMCQLKLR
jgi:hypothetical protein